jgi:hypothetical protein
VEVFAAQGHVHVVAGIPFLFFFPFFFAIPLTANAGFWQYGTVRWDEFYRYLTSFIYANTDWRLFRYDLTQRQHGDLCQPDNQIVQPGQYVLLSTCK